MSFIHLNKVDHQTDVAAELLVRRSEERREADGAMGEASLL